MKVSAAVSVAVASLVSAQGINDIPACALPCITKAVTTQTKCSIADIPCVCGKESFAAVQAAATGCVIEKCGAGKAISDVLPSTQKLCAAFGNAAGDDSGNGTKPDPTKPASSTPTGGDDDGDDDGEDDDGKGDDGKGDDGDDATPTTTMHPQPTCDEGNGKANDEPDTPGSPVQGGNGTHPMPTVPVTAGAAGLAPVGIVAVLVGALAL
ncbi:hypothetical protein E4U53_000524 [Claviceps sorghi]|nr:hypothetical protein E4U53_000524 [Claviceps sorghi]